MLSQFFFIAVAIATSTAMHLSTFNGNCDGHTKGGRINFIDVGGCSSEPCIVHPGSTYSIHVNLTTTKHVTELHNKLYGVIAGVPLPFPVSPENNCGETGVTCPMASGTTFVYHLSLTCPSFAPQIKLSAKWYLKDRDGSDILCFVIPLEIRS